MTYRHSDKHFDFLTWQEVISERNMIINSSAANTRALYGQLHGALSNRDFPIANGIRGYERLYVTAISQSRMILPNGAHTKLDSKRLSEHL